MNGNNIGLRIVAALVLLAAITGAYFAFQAGVAQDAVTISAIGRDCAIALSILWLWALSPPILIWLRLLGLSDPAIPLLPPVRGFPLPLLGTALGLVPRRVRPLATRLG
jgi:hypothetical protein